MPSFCPTEDRCDHTMDHYVTCVDGEYDSEYEDEYEGDPVSSTEVSHASSTEGNIDCAADVTVLASGVDL